MTIRSGCGHVASDSRAYEWSGKRSVQKTDVSGVEREVVGAVSGLTIKFMTIL